MIFITNRSQEGEKALRVVEMVSWEMELKYSIEKVTYLV
jgi:hypothetical protein